MMLRRLVLAIAALSLVAAEDRPPPRVGPDWPVIGAGYQPRDKDERGLWMQVDEAERELKKSNFVVRDPGLNGYVRKVFCRTVGQAECAGIRIYVLRTPYFNAEMAPNGMMLVFSGLFLRTRNEAQLAAVLGHEYIHYAHRHSLRNFRDLKNKTNALAWLSVVPVASYAALAVLSAAQLGLIASIFRYSRAMEAEADAGSVPLLVKAGYDPREASRIWAELRDEQDATALARNRKSRKDRDGGVFGTHPNSAERMAALRALAEAQAPPAATFAGRVEYIAGVGAWWPTFLDDQIKLNDFGGTDFLLSNLARDGWTPELLYARGELYRSRGRADDLTAAAGCYRQAIAAGGAVPAEAWRGLGLVELRAGHTMAGQAALKTYLAKKPDATDRAMLASLAGA